MSAIPLDVEIDGAMHRVLLTREQSGVYFAEIDGLSMRVDVCHPEAGVLSLLIEGRAHRCVLVKGEE